MALEKFHYATEAGAKISLPKFKLIPIGVVRRVRHEPDVEQVFASIEAVADAATLAVVDQMLPDEFRAFMQAWQEDSGVTMGESSASSGS